MCELVRSGALPSVRIGGARRVHGVDLVEYVESLDRVASLNLLAETVGAR